MTTVSSRFAEIVGVSPDEVDPAANLVEKYHLDSVNALKLISQVEVEFDIDIAEKDAQRICTLNDVVALIEAKTPAV
jgi:acyl carrier protein